MVGRAGRYALVSRTEPARRQREMGIAQLIPGEYINAKYAYQTNTEADTLDHAKRRLHQSRKHRIRKALCLRRRRGPMLAILQHLYLQLSPWLDGRRKL